MEKSYKNLGFVLMLLIPLTFLAFYKSYILRTHKTHIVIDVYTHLHAFISTAWILMLIVQPLLIRYRKRALHKLLGKVSYVVFPLLILSFFPQMVRSYARGEIADLLNPSVDIILLILFYSLAIRHKKKVNVHMRYMICTAIVFLSPLLIRIIRMLLHGSDIVATHINYSLINLLILGLILWDKSNKRNYRPYLVALSGFILYQIAVNLVIYVF